MSGIAQRRGAAGLAGQRLSEGDIVRGAVVVDVVRAQHRARELLQQVVLFVGEAVAADDADGLAAARVAQLARSFCRRRSSACSQLTGFKLAVGLADQRLCDAARVSWRSRRRSGPCCRGSRR